MLFNSIEFPIFLIAVLTIYWAFRSSFRIQNLMLLGASYVFYGWWDVRFLFLIVVSTAIDYVSGLLIDKGDVPLRKRAAVSGYVVGAALLFLLPNWEAANFHLLSWPQLDSSASVIATNGPWLILAVVAAVLIVNIAIPLIKTTSDQTRRRTALIVSIGANLTILGFFKYFDFFANGLSTVVEQITGSTPGDFTLGFILPVGISFYTFQTMSYTIDLYRNKTRSTDRLIEFAAYVAFFPQLVAGPIERASRLLPQFQKSRPALDMERLKSSVWLICWGLFKKMVVADNMAVVVNATFGPFDDPNGTFAVPQDGLTLLVGVYAFALQIYGDFSGYTDIARGVARLLGFDLMLNFNLPYFATSPSDFWRRWHISLSTWLRDYLYIPLGGNRSGGWGTYRNLTIVMLLGGLWHGAGWNFLIWGAYQGALLCIYRLIGFRTEQKELSMYSKLFFGFIMFNLTCIGWLLFRAQNVETIKVFFVGIFTSPYASEQTWLNVQHILFYGWFLIAFQIGQALMRDLDLMKHLHWFLRLNIWIYIIMSLLILADTSRQEFIYFAF